MTEAEARIVEAMKVDDRALYRRPHDHSPNAPYGWGSPWKKVATRKQVDSLISQGVIEFYHCYPPDLRAMLVKK